jgi:hypothetical protein
MMRWIGCKTDTTRGLDNMLRDIIVFIIMLISVCFLVHLFILNPAQAETMIGSCDQIWNIREVTV